VTDDNIVEIKKVSRECRIDFKDVGAIENLDKTIIGISYSDERDCPDEHYAVDEFTIIYKDKDGDFAFIYCIDDIDNEPLRMFLLEALKDA